MSYDLTFYNKKSMTIQEVWDFLEEKIIINEIETVKKHKIIEELREQNLQFEIEESENDIELNFKTFQLSIFNDEISLSIPYWDNNKDKKVISEINTICEILFKNDLTGYDPQSDTIFENYDYEEMFKINLEKVSPIMNELVQNKNQKRLKILIVFVLIIFIIFWMIKFF